MNFLAFGILAISISLAASFNVHSNANKLLNDDLAEKVHVGDTIEIPEKEITHDGVTKTMKSYVVSPHGSSFKNNKFVANEAGKYRVHYYEYFDNEEVYEDYFIDSIRTPKDMFVIDGNASIQNGVSKLHTVEKEVVKGVNVTSKGNEVVRFNKQIDATKCKQDDVLVEFLIEPHSIGDSDFSYLDIKLVDAINPNNYIDITFKDPGPIDTSGKGCYIDAGANGQIHTGYEWNTLHRGDKFGMGAYFSFRGLPEEEKYHMGSLYYDNTQKALYFSPRWGAKDKAIITDLDDRNIYASNPFKGFESGRFYVEFSTSGVKTGQVNYSITKILDYDLSVDELVDEQSPSLIIEEDENNTSGVYRSFLGAEYPLFSVTAVDDYDDDLKVESQVIYYDENNDRDVNISIKNGKFHTYYYGQYTIKYFVSDYSNNSTNVEISVFCYANRNPIIFDVPLDVEDATVFDEVSLIDLSEVSVSGGYGNIAVTRKIFDENNLEVDEINNKFTPYSVGNYKVIYYAQDKLGQVKEITHIISVSQLTKPVFKNIYLPEVFLNGFTYQIPDVIAYGPGDNDAIEKLDVDVYINNQKLETKEFKASGDSVEIAFEASSYREIIVVPVIDGDEGRNKQAYFYSQVPSYSFSQRDKSVALSLSESGEILFSNILSTHSLFLDFGFDVDYFQSSGIDIVLIDSVNMNKTVTISVSASKTLFVKYPFDNTNYQISSVNGEFWLSYQSYNHELIDMLGKNIGKINYFDDSSSFTGFDNGVYLKIVFKNVLGPSTLLVSQINNQTFYSSQEEDMKKPEIILNHSYSQSVRIGDTVTISSAKAYDVLNYIDDFTVSVKNQDGKYIINNESPSKEYSFVADKAGTISVTYFASDKAGNILKKQLYILVMEVEPPVLDVASLKKTYSLNSSVAIPDYSISDSSYYRLDVSLITPNNKAYLLIHDENGISTSYIHNHQEIYSSDKAFYVRQAGYYYLQFVAVDKYGNLSIIRLSFEVK